ncbi:transmembrane protein 214-A [Chelonus insularis]|uniref:transmembrane protein 214-A n=1 Tax=Chelonus insularis TaxID=460826 RepID=UPI00158ADABD|nr:transmembrane protein 214-A [Chelonus insularis]
MSSGGWEVVTKNKKDKNGAKNTKLTKTEKKKIIENSPKVEDFLPLSQVKTLYDNFNGSKENKTPKDKENKTKENEEKKKQQKMNQQNKKKENSKPKEKVAKTADKFQVTVDQVNELLETNRTRFPDAPLIWLKDLVSFLNSNISTDKKDIALSETYLHLIPAAVRVIFEKIIKSAGQQNIQIFYEGTLLLMAKNMAFGLSSVGCRIFLQLLAQMYPEMTCMNIDKHIILRNSYQNKKNIGLAILWALSQSGKKNLAVGLTLWHEVMAPMLESRNYSHYVMKILEELLNSHVYNNVNNCTTEMYIQIVDDLVSGKIAISNGTAIGELRRCQKMLRETAMKSDKIDIQSFFETIFDKISPKTNRCNEEFLKTLTTCIAHDSRCILSWEKLYPKRLFQSELLIEQLTKDWDSISSEIDAKSLRELLTVFQVTKTKSKKSKEDSLMIACHKKAEALFNKMSATSKKGKSFPWRKGSILLLILIGAVVAFDCRNHGSFEASTTGRFIRTSGVVNYGQKAWSTTKLYSNQGLAYLETNYPDYYKSASKFGRQYTKLAGDFYLVGRNAVGRLYNNTMQFVEEKKPVVTESIEYYFPGWLNTFQTTAIKQFEVVKKYSALTTEYIVQQSSNLVRWLQTSVFVGNLSPENIRGFATKALKSTQTYASQTYDWVYEKVQTLSKVQ